MARGKVFIGVAGWQAPAALRGVPAGKSHLARYSAIFNAVEINTSFYRAHQRQTYEGWAHSTPDHFRFCVKAPKSISHERGLEEANALIDGFSQQVQGLGKKLDLILVQLPPTLAFSERKVRTFLQKLRECIPVNIVVEPRHMSWFTEDAESCLSGAGVARVAADPGRYPSADQPGGARDLNYYRFHGSPRIYYSDYGAAALKRIESTLNERAAAGACVWCIFDNTAAGSATKNAMSLARRFSLPAMQ